jgi:hypothetical protein
MRQLTSNETLSVSAHTEHKDAQNDKILPTLPSSCFALFRQRNQARNMHAGMITFTTGIRSYQ